MTKLSDLDILRKNIIQTKGAIHYLTKREIEKNKNYINVDKEDKKIVSFVIGGPNQYYNFSEKQINIIFNKVKTLFTPDKDKLIVIPSYRTPDDIIKKAFNTFSHNHIVIKSVEPSIGY